MKKVPTTLERERDMRSGSAETSPTKRTYLFLTPQTWSCQRNSSSGRGAQLARTSFIVPPNTIDFRRLSHDRTSDRKWTDGYSRVQAEWQIARRGLQGVRAGS